MSDADPMLYRVRLTERAYYDYHQARLYVRAVSGDVAMGEWERGFSETLKTLEYMPYRSIVPESDLFKRETRQLTYRAKGASYSHRIVYQIDESGDLRVAVIHVRHASQDSISRFDADVLERQAALDLPPETNDSDETDAA